MRDVAFVTRSVPLSCDIGTLLVTNATSLKVRYSADKDRQAGLHVNNSINKWPV